MFELSWYPSASEAWQMLDVLIFHFSLWLVLHSVCLYISFFIIISSSVSSEQTCLIISTSLFCTFTSVQQLVLVINQLLSLAHLAASALCHSTGSSSFSTVQENQDLLTFSCLLSAQLLLPIWCWRESSHFSRCATLGLIGQRCQNVNWWFL